MASRITQRANRESPPLVTDRDAIPGWIGDSPPSQRIRQAVLRLRGLADPVLVLGETGTGKELVAMALAAGSKVVVQNCATDHGDRWDDELFGHERHAFTGAEALHPGWFEQAAGGALVLDEFGELPWQAQGALLRVIEGKAFRRVGGRHDVAPRLRVIATTNRDLDQAVCDGRFRADLYARFLDRVVVPTLAERRQDVPAIAAAFHGNLCRERGAVLPRPSQADVRQWQRAQWPDNVRELQRTVRAVALGDPGDTYRPRPWAGSGPSGAKLSAKPSHREIDRVLRSCGGNRTQAAARLGVDRTTLWRWLQ